MLQHRRILLTSNSLFRTFNFSLLTPNNRLAQTAENHRENSEMGIGSLFHVVGADGADIQVCACIYHPVDGDKVCGAEDGRP